LHSRVFFIEVYNLLLNTKFFKVPKEVLLKVAVPLANQLVDMPN